jgi:hypothetical protein
MIRATLFSLMAISSPCWAETYFEILEGGFASAAEALSFADISVVGDPAAKTCVEVDSATPYNDQRALIFKFTRSSDGVGPVLPPHEETKVLYGVQGSNAFQYEFSRATTTVTGSQITTIVEYSADNTYTLRVRKAAPYLYFRRSGTNGTGEFLAYGYCFSPEAAR